LLHELRAVSIELFHDDPGEEFEGWANDDLPSTVEARRQATQRLAVAMKTTAMPVVRRASLLRWLLLLPVFFAVGAGAAWALRERPLISATVQDEETIPRQDTAESQWLYAFIRNSEAAWQSVPQYFPDDKTYTRRAKQSLALLYLQEYDYRRAMELFDEFAGYNDAEVQFKAFGLAGQAIVLNRQKQYGESAEKLVQLWPLRDKLEGEMRYLIETMLSQNRPSRNDAKSLLRWRQWFRESPPAESNGTSARRKAAPGRFT
jgi:hypothetical protein